MPKNKVAKDEEMVDLEDHSSAKNAHLDTMVDEVPKLRKIAFWYIVGFFVFMLITLIIQSVMVPFWLTSTPLALLAVANVVVGILATKLTSQTLSNVMWWFIAPGTAGILTIDIIYGLYKFFRKTSRYGSAVIFPVILLGIGILGSVGVFVIYYKLSRAIKARR